LIERESGQAKLVVFEEGQELVCSPFGLHFSSNVVEEVLDGKGPLDLGDIVELGVLVY
jgi:hypothetical protein